METPDDIKNLELMTEAKNYNRWLYDTIKENLGKRILEVGGGLGNMTHFFLDKELVVSTDVLPQQVKYLREKFSEYPNYYAEETDISEEYLALRKYNFDTVVLINVLEHIRDDIKCLDNIYDLLPTHGKLILILPAFSFAFGTIDISDKHYRRYNSDFVVILEKIGYRIIKRRYMNMIGLLGWIWHGKIAKIKLHNKYDITLFERLVPVLRLIERIVPPPFGLSLIIICEKNRS